MRGNPNKLREFQFKKGQSGNPKGRPPDVLKMLRKHRYTIEEVTRIYEQDPRLARVVAEAVWAKAMSGHSASFWYIFKILDRMG